MSVYKTLRDEIVAQLQAVQLSGSAAFVEVLTKPTGEFTGTPAATVLPSEVMSDYITVAQNQRGYGFMIEIHLSLDGQDWEETVDTSMDLIDAVIDKLDQTIDLNGKADFLKAVPLMGWATVKDTDGLIVMPSVHVIAIKDVDVR